MFNFNVMATGSIVLACASYFFSPFLRQLSGIGSMTKLDDLSGVDLTDTKTPTK